MEHDWASGSGRCLRCGAVKNQLHTSPECYGPMRPGMPQVFQYADVHRNADRLFGIEERGDVRIEPLNGKQDNHCGICPKPWNELCQLSCAATRRELNDGITVS